jgi:outer membrane protein assembly factor BamB
MRNAVLLAAAACLCIAFFANADAQGQGVLTYHGDAARSGNYIVPGLTWDKARNLRLDPAFNAQVSGRLYAQPLYWRPPGANAGMLVTAGEDNVVQAFDGATGRELWRRAVGSPVPRGSLPCGNVSPLGITGTPVIDPSAQALYLDAAVQDASGPRHRIFALALKDGSVLSGWPLDVADALRAVGQTFDPRVQNQRSALTLLDGTLFVAFGGHFGDCGDYHGWVVGVALNDPGRVASWRTGARGGGIWAPGGLAVVGRDVFFATGNTFGASAFGDGEAVFRLGLDLRRSDDPRNFFAPSNWLALDQSDADLGGTNPVPLDVPGASGSEALMLALGKDGKAYLLDRNNLGGIGGQLAVAAIANGSIITAPAVYPAGDGVFVAFQASGARCPGQNGSGLTVLQIKAGSPPTMTTAWCAAVRGRGSAMVTTTDGHSNPIVWMLGAEGDNRLHGFRGDTGETIFTGDALAGLRHFQTPIATQDRLYVGTDGRVFAFGF